MNSESKEFRIVSAQTCHLDQLTECHIQAFRGQFMTLIGKRFVKDFYKFYMLSDDGILLVAINSSGNVVGLVAGGEPKLRRNFILKRVPLHVPQIIIGALRSSIIRGRLFEHLVSAIKKNKTNQVDPPPDSLRCASLLSICTVPDLTGKGVGSLLMEGFRAESEKQGFEAMRLSVHLDNSRAIKFYNKCGWQVFFTNSRGMYFRKLIKE
jgi:ribosomal protein S18 acetylase RimI-like enzyme